MAKKTLSPVRNSYGAGKEEVSNGVKAKFITFEGPEGCGKSTHARLLVKHLKSRRKKILLTREPGGTKSGELIRKVVLYPTKIPMSAECEAFLYLAARSQIIKEVIYPALCKGTTVICDRFHDATIVYQGYAGGLDIKLLKKLGDFATGGIRPDLTILLDLPVKTGLKRAGIRDRMEKKPLAFHSKVRDGYLDLARKNPKRIKVVRVHKDISSTQNEIRRIVKRFLTQ